MLEQEEVNKIDEAGLWRAYQQWPDAAVRAMNQKLALPDAHSPKLIALAGMGGSGTACDIVADWLSMNSDTPVVVVKDFHLPSFVGKGSLVVVVSLSGSTKEMLSLFDEAVKRGCCVVAVSSGGPLEDRCKERGVPHNRVERIMVPRASLPGMVFVTLRILNDLGLVDSAKALHEASLSMRKMALQVSPSVPSAKNPAKRIARTLRYKRPVIYTPSRYASVGHHFAASMNENAKIPVDVGCYPEIFHNEIETWKAAAGRAVVLLRSKNEDEVVGKKLAAAKSILTRAGIHVTEVDQSGGPLSSLLNWCLLLDMVAVYVAVLRKTPPVETPLIDRTRSL